ncbi:UNVERIFIED_CONTAM: hypothetical protein Sradi_3464400 [Sesamum radiatum]|uniref:Uncharacterized protein n=1 Tax=Sesamum radiatum TaxID=300843 RepID=A0AAW2R5S0_SESRA
MEASGGNSDAYTSSSSTTSTHSRRHGLHISASNILRSPLSTLLEYTGILRTRSNHSESDPLLTNGAQISYRDHHLQPHLNDSPPLAAANSGGTAGEVSIRIIGASEHEHDTVLHSVPVVGQLSAQTESFPQPISRSGSAVSVLSSLESHVELRSDREAGDGVTHSTDSGGDTDGAEGAAANNRDSSSSYQRYDIQQAARWIEQVLPFSLLLLVVFIRQHLQGIARKLYMSCLKLKCAEKERESVCMVRGIALEGFCVTIWIAAFMFKSNDVVRKQTALKGERRISVLIGIAILFTLHVVGIYWWYRNDDLLYPLLMLPLRPYRLSGCDIHCHGECMLPFLRHTGSSGCNDLQVCAIDVQSFITALRALSRKDIHYGAYATSEQGNVIFSGWILEGSSLSDKKADSYSCLSAE